MAAPGSQDLRAAHDLVVRLALILAAAPGLWSAFSTCGAAEHAVTAAAPRVFGP